MSYIKLILKKELKGIFFSPLAYVLLSLFSIIMGWLFFNYLMVTRTQLNQSVEAMVIGPIFGTMNFLFLCLCPLLTMKSFSEERKRGTYILFELSQVKYSQVILGKFLSYSLFLLFFLAVSLILPIVLWIAGYENWNLIITSFLGSYLSALCYLSLGIFSSSLTENQIIAAVIAFSLSFFIMLLVITANATTNPLVGQIFQYFSIAFHYEGFSRGVIKSYNIVFYISFIGYFLWLTKKSLESKKW